MATETENVKQSHDGANQGSIGHLTHKGPCKTVPVQEEIYRRWITLRHRLQTGHDRVTVLCYEQIRHLHTTSLLVIAAEKDTHVHNREHVPLSLNTGPRGL